IRQAMIDLAEGSAAVLVISQDLEELFDVSDRLAVICKGRLSAAHPVNSITVDEIGLLMSGISEPAPEAVHAD
ncbi:MAG: ABC transporter ATP-binding protein, partial [Rhodospirillaceae bacterium]